MKYGVARDIARCLKDHGVDHVFFVTGGDQPFWIALRDAGMRLVLARSEASAVYMADAFARVTGRPAVTYGQWGPGAANVAAALADAWWARSPVVAICSGVRTAAQFKNDYQEIDQARMFDPVTKWNRTLTRADRAVEMVATALRVAVAGCPRPAHLTIPRDMLEADGEVRDGSRLAPDRGLPEPNPGSIERALAILGQAHRPVIIAGNGVLLSRAEAELQELADLLGIPVATSAAGKGAFPEDHPLALGVAGRYSRKISNDALAEADAVLVVGSDLGGMVTNGYQLPSRDAQVIQVDVDAETLGATRPVSVAIQADARAALRAMAERARGPARAAAHRRWCDHVRSRIADWRERVAEAALGTDRPGCVRPEAALALLRERASDADVVVADTGYMAAWAAALYPVRKAGRHFIRAAGSLGWALPAALGAQLARPDSRAICITGDGGVGYHIGDLETAVRLRIPTIVLVFNNGSLAFEYHMQKYHYESQIVPEVNDFADVDYGAVARAFGAFGAKARSREEMVAALDEAFAERRPALIDVAIDKERFAPVTSYESVIRRDL